MVIRLSLSEQMALIGTPEYEEYRKAVKWLDFKESLMQMPLADRAQIILYFLGDHPHLAKSRRGAEIIRVCKSAIGPIQPYHGEYERHLKRVDDYAKNLQIQERLP